MEGRTLHVGLVREDGFYWVQFEEWPGCFATGDTLDALLEALEEAEMLVAVGAGFVPFIGIIYSMLFLVVQFGSTMYTPRLNLFRDSPIVWHGFSFFTAVIVFALTPPSKSAPKQRRRCWCRSSSASPSW